MANLVLNGKSIDSIDDIAENFVEEDVLREFRSGSLASWLEEYGYEEELERVRSIKPTASSIRVLAGISEALNLDDDVIAAAAERRTEQQRKEEAARKAREEQQRKDEEARQRREREERESRENVPQQECAKGQPTADNHNGLPDIDKVTNWKEAVSLYTAAANAGDAYAQGCLAVCYDHLRFTKKSCGDDVLFTWARKSADQGNHIGQRMLGEFFMRGTGVEPNPTESVKWTRMAADQGDLHAQNYLAFCYERGMGVKRDCELALKLYNDAAERGFPPAQCEMGMRYFNGKGVVKNWEKAVDWFRKAAENGHDWAQLKLGWCYRGGFGVPKDRELGREWCLKFTKQGGSNASFIDDGQRDKSYRIDYSLCGLGVGMDCRVCVEQCPTGAITTKVCKVCDTRKCSYCSSCEDVCPVGAIETFTFNPTACINCGSCMSACPEGAIYTGMRCVMDTDICSRCGICAVACPANCIVVDNKKK